jgi:hypothetical protein
MAGATFDFVIVGSTPFAALLAGSLARTHGKRVLRIGRRPSPQRLPRRLDLALPIATRPQTWDLLARGEAETRALIASMGAPDAIVPMDVMVRGDTEASSAALAHLAHVALGYGLKVRHLDGAWTLRGVPLLRSERLEDKVAEWLTAAGVASIDPDEVRFEFGGKGNAEFVLPEAKIDGAEIVLADDSAILEMPEDLRPPTLSVEPVTVTLTAKVKTLSAPVQIFADRAVTLMQRPDGGVLALTAGETDIDKRLASTFAGPFPIPRLATGRSRRVVTADATLFIGRAAPAGPMVIAGFGDAGAFFAPAAARFLAGAAGEYEAAWFAARQPAKTRPLVSELAS